MIQHHLRCFAIACVAGRHFVEVIHLRRQRNVGKNAPVNAQHDGRLGNGHHVPGGVDNGFDQAECAVAGLGIVELCLGVGGAAPSLKSLEQLPHVG